jgi:hypothetical protein
MNKLDGDCTTRDCTDQVITLPAGDRQVATRCVSHHVKWDMQVDLTERDNTAPTNYEALFDMYYDYVCKLVRKFGIDEQNKEDVASDVLLRFYERNFLEKFDPDFVTEYNGEIKPARFQSFLNAFVSLYVRGHRGNQKLRKDREPLMVDKPLDAGGVWIEVFSPHETDPGFLDVESSMVLEETLQSSIKAHLSPEGCLVLDHMSEQIATTGKFQVSRTATDSGWGLKKVKLLLQEIRVATADVISTSSDNIVDVLDASDESAFGRLA